MDEVLPLWFGFERPVDRRAYLLNGIALTVIKFCIDSALLWQFAGRTWTLWDYFIPMWEARQELMSTGPAWLPPVLLVVALPFLWIGVSMSARRAVDAGSSAWVALLFFVPVMNLALMAALAL